MADILIVEVDDNFGVSDRVLSCFVHVNVLDLLILVSYVMQLDRSHASAEEGVS